MGSIVTQADVEEEDEDDAIVLMFWSFYNTLHMLMKTRRLNPAVSMHTFPEHVPNFFHLLLTVLALLPPSSSSMAWSVKVMTLRAHGGATTFAYQQKFTFPTLSSVRLPGTKVEENGL